MSGLTRREMKRDEVREGLIRVVYWIEENIQKILIAIAAIVVALILFWVARSIFEAKAEKAQGQLAHALEIASAPILELGAEPESATAPSFASEEARRTRLAALLTEIPKRTDAGKVASVYLGDIAVREGRADEARERWRNFVEDHSNHALAAVVESSLISLDRQEGQTESLISRLRGFEVSGRSALPRDVLLYELGVTLEDSGDGAEAGKVFKKLVEEFPQSSFSSKARSRPSYSSELN